MMLHAYSRGNVFQRKNSRLINQKLLTASIQWENGAGFRTYSVAFLCVLKRKFLVQATKRFFSFSIYDIGVFTLFYYYYFFQGSWFSVDGEPFDARPIQVTVHQDKLKFFTVKNV